MINALVIFVILFVSTNVWAARGVDCTNIKAPDLSELGLLLDYQHVYEQKKLGASITYQSRYHLLSYYSFDFGLEFINQEALDRLLAMGVNEILDRYSEKGVPGEEGKVIKEEHFVLQDDVKYFPEGVFNEVGMQKFINQGVYMTSIQKNSLEPMKKLEIITIGTDGYCIHKVRWTTMIYPEYESTPLSKFLGSFESYLTEFYSLFEKINSN